MLRRLRCSTFLKCASTWGVEKVFFVIHWYIKSISSQGFSHSPHIEEAFSAMMLSLPRRGSWFFFIRLLYLSHNSHVKCLWTLCVTFMSMFDVVKRAKEKNNFRCCELFCAWDVCKDVGDGWADGETQKLCHSTREKKAALDVRSCVTPFMKLTHWGATSSNIYY